MFKIVVLSALVGLSMANKFNFINKCSHTVWVATQGNPNKGNPENGGFQLNAGQTHSFNTVRGWAGRMWGKTGCQANGQGCDDTQVNTLGEWTLWNKAGDIDFYDVSLVDGYNLPMRIQPVAGTFIKEGNRHYDCGVAGCNADLNKICPSELQVKKGSETIACLSACSKFRTDEYCCRGAHGTPQTCKSSMWPKNYPATFKQACPEAYSYAYDDNSSTFTCKGNPDTAYDVTFCP